MTSSDSDIDLLGYLIHDLAHALRLAVLYTQRADRERGVGPGKDGLAKAYAACRDAEARLGNARALWQAQSEDRLARTKHLSLHKAVGIVMDVVETVTAVRGDNSRSVRVDVEALRKHDQRIPLDPALFRQAMWNLVQNAFEYSFTRETIWVSGRAQGGDRVEFTIRSRGLTIHEDELRRITDRGIRGREAAKVGPGSGFGLYVTRRILDMCGGRLTVEAQSDVTTARIKLPTA